ncbi:hypothetical protein LSH36_279g02066 [Paralvinella palmiformis]|uniref:Immediate early response 3-interacting protein 1 n=1 Tax=Paralvinella palmiformis TaxID=53620 RepID=A0AAD9N1T3_9ANNE|nr:hypothetical protein LSH36_279g02066 [Paralvinella palmiformis]
MVLGLYSLLESVVLCINAVCILHEERFLSKIGWGSDQRGFGEEPGVKAQIINLIRSVRTVMKIPLIVVNTAMILLKLVFG